MTKLLGYKDWLIVITLAIITIVLAYLFGWMAILLIFLLASAYLVYKWYGAGRPLRPT